MWSLLCQALNSTQKIFGPFPYLIFYSLIFPTRHFTVEIILYSATWGLNVTCFTFRYFKPRKESCHCILALSFFSFVFLLPLFHWQEGRAFLPTYFTLQYRWSNHYMVSMVLLMFVASPFLTIHRFPKELRKNSHGIE